MTMTKEQQEKVEKFKKEMVKIEDADNKMKEFKTWIETKFQEVLDHILLDFVSSSFHYHDSSMEHKDGGVVFTVAANEKYHQMSINIYQPAFRMWLNKEYDTLVGGIVHECAHMHTDRLTKVAEDRYATRSQVHDANEYLTEVIAQYVRSLIKTKTPQIFTK